VSHLDHLRQQLPLVLEERPEVPSTGNDLKYLLKIMKM
jgi:hypothetical protein